MEKLNVEMRCRCQGHMITLIVSAFLAGDDTKSVEEEDLEEGRGCVLDC